MTGQPTTASEAVAAARVVFSSDDRREISDRVAAALSSGALTLGENTREFEAAFARAHDIPHAIAVTSGTAALEIIFRALDVAGREVVIPANTFAATAFAVQSAGGRPVFADIDPSTAAVTVASVSEALTERTAAVVVVHIGGTITPDVVALRELCDARGIALVEDAAHAHGCQLDGRFAGAFGVAAAFSFYPTKVITSGEGGMITTADERIRSEALVYRDQGKAGFHGNLHTRHGYAWRMSELHAATGLVHFRHLDEFIAVRRGVAGRYAAALQGIEAVTPLRPADGARSNYYKYPVLLGPGLDRAAVKSEVREQFAVNLSGEVYETPLHHQPVFAELATRPLPGAEEFCARHVCLPIHSDMTDAEADRVLDAFLAVTVR